MIPARRSGRRKPVCSEIAPPCEKPASTRRRAAVPRASSRAMSASTNPCDARTPRSSSRRAASPPAMSYHARMTMPLLIVTGCIGACGKTNRIGTSGRSSSPTIGTKSLPSAPRPCSQITLVAGRGAVAISIASRTSLTRRASRLGTLRGLRPECLHDRLASLDVRAADQVDAIRDRGEDARHEGLAAVALHALERLADRLRLSGQVDDERALPDDRNLAREDRGRHEPQAHLPHLLAEPRHHLVRDGERRLRRHVARRRAGAAGRQHEVAPFGVDERGERPLDRRLLVGNQALDALPLRGEGAAEPFLERGQAFVLVDAGRGAVADRDEPDLERAIRCGHAADYIGGVAAAASRMTRNSSRNLRGSRPASRSFRASRTSERSRCRSARGCVRANSVSAASSSSSRSRQRSAWWCAAVASRDWPSQISSFARIGPGSTSRISRPMYCSWRRCPSRLRTRFASATAAASGSGSSISASWSALSVTSRSPSAWRASISCLRFVLLGASSSDIGASIAPLIIARHFAHADHRSCHPMPDSRFTYAIDALRTIVADTLKLARDRGA